MSRLDFRHNPLTVGSVGKASLIVALAVTAALLLAQITGAAVPGPNGLIAFQADEGNGSQIYTIEPDGTGQKQLTFMYGDDLIRPHWSADDSLITFELDTPDTCANVAYMHADGTHITVLPLAKDDICEGSPSFSPDGRLFYEAFNGHRDDIWTMNLDGTDRHWVTNCEGRGATDPEVSPSGTMLAFTCYQRKGSALFDSNIDGSHLRQLTPFSFNVGVHEDWSPDSGHIMFISTHDEGSPDAQVNTGTIRPDGTDLRWLTNYSPGGLLAYGNSYSPDGRWIVLRLEDHSLATPFALYLMHPDGSGLTPITPFSNLRRRGMAWGSLQG
jgi:Tol biopolymer transport system component